MLPKASQDLAQILNSNLNNLLIQIANDFKPYSPQDIISWVEENVCNPPGSPLAFQPFNFELSPWVKPMLTALCDKRVREFGCIKASATSITSGVLINYLLYTMANQPCDVIGMLPNDSMAKRFLKTKIKGTVRASPKLGYLMDLSNARNGNTQHVVNYVGGYTRLTGSGSSGELDADHVKVVFCDEVGRCDPDSDGQGHSVDKLDTRIKSFGDSLSIKIGTPGNLIDDYMVQVWERSDKRYFPVPCHKCGSFHPLKFENVVYETYQDNERVLPKNVFYKCPFCSELWSESQKRANVRNLYEEATREFTGTICYYVNACYSLMPNGTLENMVKKYLEAKAKSDSGDESTMKVFVNTYLGEAYEYKSGDDVNLEELKARVADYQRGIVPKGGLLLAAGVDKQHNRYHVLIVARGRDSENWLVDRQVFYGNTNDPKDPVHKDLSDYLFQPFEHETGRMMYVRAVSIDSSDRPQTVYDFVHKYRHKPNVMAVRGSSWDEGTKPIFSVPKKADTKGGYNDKLNRHGLKIYMVGTFQAKELIFSRLKLKGEGAGRYHFYKSVEPAFFDQVLSEQKVIVNSGKWRYVKKSGRENEDLDCLVYVEHAFHVLKTHTLNAAAWTAIENNLFQANLFEELEKPVKVVVGDSDSDAVEDVKAVVKPVQQPVKPMPQKKVLTDSGGFWI